MSTCLLRLHRPLAFLAARAMSTATSSSSSSTHAYQITPYDTSTARWTFTRDDFRRLDESSDTEFYNQPRFVHHIDSQAVMALTKYYTSQLPQRHGAGGSKILDLCSSWVSHLDSGVVKELGVKVHGTGLNEEELKKNELLDRWGVQDLNTTPEIDNGEGRYQMSICSVSIDYLSKPLDVLKSVAANTQEGGTVHLAISNRCFPTKVVNWWRHREEEQRLDGVCSYLYFCGRDPATLKKGDGEGGGLWEKIEVVEVVGKASDERGGNGGFGGWLRELRGGGDPLWVVRGKRTGKVAE